MLNYKKIKSKSAFECSFCNVIKEELLYASDNFNVLIDVAPILEGHILICSNKHYSCAGDIPLQFYSELEYLKELVNDYLHRSFGTAIFFEHGRAGHCTMTLNDRLCYHFHLHALPTQKDITNLLNKRFAPIELKQLSELPDNYQRFGEYLYYEDLKGHKYFYPVPQVIESHLMRTLIAETHNVKERAEWPNNNDPSLFLKTKKKFLEMQFGREKCANR